MVIASNLISPFKADSLDNLVSSKPLFYQKLLFDYSRFPWLSPESYPGGAHRRPESIYFQLTLVVTSAAESYPAKRIVSHTASLLNDSRE